MRGFAGSLGPSHSGLRWPPLSKRLVLRLFLCGLCVFRYVLGDGSSLFFMALVSRSSFYLFREPSLHWTMTYQHIGPRSVPALILSVIWMQIISQVIVHGPRWLVDIQSIGELSSGSVRRVILKTRVRISVWPFYIALYPIVSLILNISNVTLDLVISLVGTQTALVSPNCAFCEIHAFRLDFVFQIELSTPFSR